MQRGSPFPGRGDIVPGPLSTGLLFISVFWLIAMSTSKRGLAVTTTAAKMSVVIPMAAGFALYGESAGVLTITGMALALVAVYLMVSPSGTGLRNGGWRAALLPAWVFIGSGLADTSVKYTQHHHMSSGNIMIVMGLVFLTAGLGGLPFSIGRAIRGRSFTMKHLAWGCLFGLINFFSLYFLFKCLHHPGASSAVVFTTMNAGVVVLCAAAARILFGESLSAKNLVGMTLSVISIIMLSNGFD
jgi:uncharacterized membrane protein